MALDKRQIIAKLKVARGIIREVKKSFEFPTLDYNRCVYLVQDIEILIDSVSHE